MKSKLLLLFSLILITSCNQSEDNYIICDSNYIFCNFFEIKFPDISQLSDDYSQLSIEDLNTYKKLSQDHKNNPESDSVFATYSEIFIPRFAYSILDIDALEKLWFGLALYPLDYKNNLETVTGQFYNEYQGFSKTIYGECKRDDGSYLKSNNSIIYNCIKDGVKSYDYWVTDEAFMWKMKCVWEEDKFEGINLSIVKSEIVTASDTCRKSFESFQSKIN